MNPIAQSEKKYWVPTLERAHEVLRLISREPAKWKMSDMCKKLNISKSTMFSLINTMESLNWIVKSASDTYAPGLFLGILGNAYFNQFDLTELFNKEAVGTMLKVDESIQLARLDGAHVLYMAKITGSSPIQMVSGPGARIPAHATGLGKVLLSDLSEEQIFDLYPDEKLPQLTAYTVDTRSKLMNELDKVRCNGYAEDLQEGVMGFCCAAAPVYNVNGVMAASVSISMPLHQWESKRELSIQEVCRLGARLSLVQP